MNWFFASVLAMIFFGVYPIFGNKAGQIHGEKINFIIDGVIMFFISIVLSIIYREDFQKITRTSFYYSLALGLSSIGFILMLYAWRIAPTKMPVIQITIAFCTVITAILSHVFTNAKMDFHQWIGAFIAFIGIALVSISKNNLNFVLGLFKF